MSWEDGLAWLDAQLARDEQIAREASRDGIHQTDAGEHWRWEDADTDDVIALDPVAEEYVEDCRISLRSVEEYPSGIGVTLPHFVVTNTDEIRVADAMHLARWSPAVILPLLRALRLAVREFSHEGRETALLTDLAVALYGEQADFPQEWR